MFGGGQKSWQWQNRVATVVSGCVSREAAGEERTPWQGVTRLGS